MAPSAPATSPPNLPGLSDQDVYAVVTSPHKRDASDEEETWEHDLGDRTRLAMLGMSVMDLVATQLLLMVRPVLGAEALQARRQEVLSDSNLDNWINAYRASKDESARVFTQYEAASEEELRLVFYAYVGAVFVRFGLDGSTEWLATLLEPYLIRQEHGEHFKR